MLLIAMVSEPVEEDSLQASHDSLLDLPEDSCSMDVDLHNLDKVRIEVFFCASLKILFHLCMCVGTVLPYKLFCWTCCIHDLFKRHLSFKQMAKIFLP